MSRKRLSSFLINNKIFIIKFLKITILVLTVIFLGLTFTMSFGDIFHLFVTLCLYVYIPFSVIYFVFTKNINDRKEILNMWKVYFSILTMMFILMFSMDSYVKKIKSDFYKTELMYYLRIDANQSVLQKTLNKYQDVTIKSIVYMEPEEVDYEKLFKQTNNPKKAKKYTIFYANFSASVMFIVTLFMLLWSLVSLSIFQTETNISRIRKLQEKIKNKKKR